MNLKPLLMMMMEYYKKEINNSLKEMQRNISNQVKELNKIIQDLKNGSRTNKEITKAEHSENRKSKKEVRSH
jgi:F0F1-type ATP synthase membrane subunit b/b'